MFRVTRYPMISKTELGRVGYRKKYRVAGRVRVPAGHWSPHPNIGISSIVTKNCDIKDSRRPVSLLLLAVLTTICFYLCIFGPLLAFHLDCLWYFETQCLGLTCVFKSVLQRCKSGDKGNLAIVPHGNIRHIMCLKYILGRGLVSLARIDLRSSGLWRIHPCWHAHRYRSIDSATRPS